MKLSKLEAYRVYLMSQHVWSLVIRHGGDRDVIEKELDRIWSDHCSKISHMPRSVPTLVFMKNVVEGNSFVKKYIPKH